MLQPEARIDEIAHHFVAARKSARALESYPGLPPEDLKTAYALQDEAIALYGGRICGWKVGRVHPPLSTQLGTTRLFGPALAESSMIMTESAAAVGHIFQNGFGAVEAEFMFRLGRVPAPGTKQISLEDASALIDAVFIGFEIASSPFPGINRLGPLVTISDFGNNNGILIGPEIVDWRTADLDNWNVETLIDGHSVGTGRASAFPDGPIGSVRLLVENLLERGQAITPGLFVSTGAITGVHEVVAGQRVEARFGGMAPIFCSIDNATA